MRDGSESKISLYYPRGSGVSNCEFPVVTSSYLPVVTQFDSRKWSVFDFRFMKVLLGRSGDIKFVILVEDCDTSRSSSITVMKETYLLFNSDFGNLEWETNEGGERKHYFVIFLIWGPFDCRWVRVSGVGQNLSFAFSFLVKEMRMPGQSNLFLCFHSSRTLHHPRSYKNKSSKSMLKRILRTWTSVT